MQDVTCNSSTSKQQQLAHPSPQKQENQIRRTWRRMQVWHSKPKLRLLLRKFKKAFTEHRSSLHPLGAMEINSDDEGADRIKKGQRSNGTFRWTLPSRAIAFLSCFLSFGSEASCLWNDLRQPLINQELPESVEAYQHHCLAGATCTPELRSPHIEFLVRCHSIHWEPSFLSEPVALGAAILYYALKLWRTSPFRPLHAILEQRLQQAFLPL